MRNAHKFSLAVAGSLSFLIVVNHLVFGCILNASLEGGLDNASFYAAGCVKQFNISVADVQSNIDATNYHYGGREPLDAKGKLGRCVMFPNGQVDPWSTQSVLQAPSRDLPILMIAGASHHAWTWPSRPDDQESVMAARTTIRQQANTFLRQSCSEDSLDNGHSNNNVVWILACVVASIVLLALTVTAVRRCRRPRRNALLSSNVSLQNR